MGWVAYPRSRPLQQWHLVAAYVPVGPRRALTACGVSVQVPFDESDVAGDGSRCPVCEAEDRRRRRSGDDAGEG
jgi:hypothetical protein